MQFLEVKDISVKGANSQVLQGISFSQPAFQNIAISGETGSGKSTLLKVIAGLAQPDAGQVYFEGERVKGPAEKLVAGHAGIAYLSQHFELPHSLRVEQVLKYVNTLPAEETEALYQVCHIAHLLKRKTNELSGGERQRIALARLLTTSPKLLLLDEPFSNLDMGHKNTLKQVLSDVGEMLGLTSILISHDPLDTLSWAEQVLVMKNGQILQQGTPEQVYRDPANEYVAGLFGKYSLLNVTAFSGNSKDAEKGKRMIVRPEDMRLTNEGGQAMEGSVKRVTFYGGYYEVEVALAEETVTVRVEECACKEGDPVRVGLRTEPKKYAFGV